MKLDKMHVLMCLSEAWRSMNNVYQGSLMRLKLRKKNEKFVVNCSPCT
jgi:hypothetical protein